MICLREAHAVHVPFGLVPVHMSFSFGPHDVQAAYTVYAMQYALWQFCCLVFTQTFPFCSTK